MFKLSKCAIIVRTCVIQIWVSSPHNASGYYGLKEEINDALSKEHFQATVSGAGDTSIVYARTGYLGFMIKAEDNAKSKGMYHQTGSIYYDCRVVVCVCTCTRLCMCLTLC